MRPNEHLIALAVLAALALSACGGGQTEDDTPVLRPVRTERVFASGAARERVFTGVARSGVESRISFKVGGTLERVAVSVGDQVRAGQLIAELDPTDFRLQVEDARASLAQARAQRRNASTEYERVRGLYENRNASRQDLDAARTVFESAEASVESVEKRLELAERQLQYTRLTAPIAGSIASCDVEANENVQAGQTVCLLTSGSELEVEVGVPGVLIAQVREGDDVDVKFDAVADRALPGRVTEVGVAATGTATTFPVTVRLLESDDRLRSGMAAEVAIRFDENAGGRERMVVPAFAIGEDRDGRFAWVVAPAGDEEGVGIVSRRAVTIGELSDDGIEVLDGLTDGEHIVTAGVSKLHDGQRVRFSSEDPIQ